MKSGIKKIFINIGIFFNILIGLCLIASAYAGNINPDTIAIAGLVNMSFPVWIILNILILLLDLLLKRKLSLIPIGSFLLCAGSLLNFSPVNIFDYKMSGSEKRHSFTLLTYNVVEFFDQEGIYPNKTNRTISYILSTDADIVCMQECDYLSSLSLTHVTTEQIDSIKRRYPYRKIETSGQSILSKYPFIPIDLGVSAEDRRDMTAYLVEIGDEIVTIYNLHLRSLGLDREDKALYKDLTQFKADNNIKKAKRQLVSKINDAARIRAKQAQIIRAHIDKTGGNIIVCGDFNDVPNCYAVRTISGDKMHDAYAENAFGPTITYNANRFYFRIDHVLYQGNFKAIDIERNDIKSSDHYAFLTTFLWETN